MFLVYLCNWCSIRSLYRIITQHPGRFIDVVSLSAVGHRGSSRLSSFFVTRYCWVPASGLGSLVTMSSELFLSYNIVFLYGVLMIELVFLRDLECYLLKVEATGLYQSVCLEVIVPRMSRLACVSIQTISFNVLANLNFMDFNGYVLKTIVYSSPRVYCAIYVYVCKPEPSKLLDLFSF